MGEILTQSEKGMIKFMKLNHNKKSRIMPLLDTGSSEISKYFKNPTKENIDYLFQKETNQRAYEGFIDIIKHFSVEELTILYISHMSNKHTFGYGVFTFVNDLRAVLRKEPKRANKKIKTKSIEKDEVVKVVEEKRVTKETKNEVGLFTDMFEGHKVRVLGTPEDPLFVLADVCKALALSTPSRVKERLSDGVSSTHTISDSLNRKQDIVVINEDGLYDVVMDSRKPEAKRFRKWVTSEVLPSIRKHGGYLTTDKIEDVLTDPDLLIGLATALKEERQRVKEAELLIEQAKPKVEYHDEVLQSKYLITTTEISKDLGMSANDLNTLLNKKGLIYKQSNAWMPYSDFEWLVSEGFADYHVTRWGQHFKWTERGRKMIHKIVKENLNKRQIKSLRNIEE